MRAKTGRLLVFGPALALGLWLTGCHKAESPHSGQPPDQRATLYRCPMHPRQATDRPGRCPICNMNVVLVKEGVAAPASNASRTGRDADSEGTSSVPGRVVIRLTPEKQQLIGLRTVTVEKRELVTTVRGTATVQPDEARRTKVVARFSGWVVRLWVNYPGQAVTNGQPLLTVYSPELFSTESDYHLAYRSFAKATNSVTSEQADAAHRRLVAARRRLELWQIADEEIRGLEETGPPSDELLLRSPISGYVTLKNAYAGLNFAPGETFFEITDLSHIWLRTSVFAQDLPRVEVGAKARITFPGFDHEPCTSAVAFVDPRIDPHTRRGEVRLELVNADQKLRAEMWANVEIDVPLGRMLTVPASALIDTGRRLVAFVQHADGQMEPREVSVGAKTDEYYQVRQGLKEGESVVTGALFLVDSESQLQAAIAGMGGIRAF